jgi:hypothetical protein
VTPRLPIETPHLKRTAIPAALPPWEILFLGWNNFVRLLSIWQSMRTFYRRTPLEIGCTAFGRTHDDGATAPAQKNGETPNFIAV